MTRDEIAALGVALIGFGIGAMLQSSPRVVARREAASIDTEWSALNRAAS